SRPSRITAPTMIVPAISGGLNQGESKRLKRFFLTGAAPDAAACSDISDMGSPFLIRDTWVEQRVDQVDDQDRRRSSQQQDKHNALNQIEIIGDDRLIQQIAHARVRKQVFNQDRATDEAAKAQGQRSELGQNRVANGIAQEDAPGA